MAYNLILLRVLGATAVLALLLRAPVAFGFEEDICFPQGGGAPFNCSPLPATCLPLGTTSPACVAASLAAFVKVTVQGKNVSSERSIVHADCVNLLAQAVGFSTDDANWIASDGEVPDYGQYQLSDMSGRPSESGAYKTAMMNGFKRDNFAVGGGDLHRKTIGSRVADPDVEQAEGRTEVETGVGMAEGADKGEGIQLKSRKEPKARDRCAMSRDWRTITRSCGVPDGRSGGMSKRPSCARAGVDQPRPAQAARSGPSTNDSLTLPRVRS